MTVRGAGSRQVATGNDSAHSEAPRRYQRPCQVRDGDAPVRGRCSCESSIAEWYEDYGQAVRQFSISRTADVATAEDCTSETFLRALTRRSQFSCAGAGVQPWLFTITRNIVRDHYNSARHRREVPTEFVPEDVDTVMGPEHELAMREMRDSVAALLELLPQDQATCLRLRFIEQLSVRETADLMHRTENAVRALQHRAIRKLSTVAPAHHHA
ncbi:sigma-70 family RNA polymerase sigma factor [Haloechinothrix sp. YIM 98757]|uniref:Sigma-70 family RNA polymerase sigma factor n=1 Tax=Haloechinothrix aidingensis TaxID=2752311 RepID=A0A838ADK3_9PSEU|nr:sigma-70 family RNA polymerase sigma factor [Haloechinothrix aidingensis]MBA0127208.1 sigma-70 family RNA polymerase sigma factor [Haloechinothrix aidingensis]